MLFLVAINTMTQVIVNNEGMRSLPGGGSASAMFGLGHIVIMIFTVIFSFYTNSFLLKQRKKELGLYNILGLGKRELYQLMIWETFLSFLIVLITGLITGWLWNRYYDRFSVECLNAVLRRDYFSHSRNLLLVYCWEHCVAEAFKKK